MRKRTVKPKIVKQKKEKRSWSLKQKILLGVAGALVVVLGVLAVSYIYRVTNPAEAFNPEDFAFPAQELLEVIEAPATPTPAPDETPAPPTPTPDPNEQLRADADMSLLQKRLNIMLLGIDESTERANWGSFRTDTMILLTINFDTKDVDMISIPRDSYVKIYGSDNRAKVNSAFSAGGGANKKGYEFAMKTISGIFGNIPINYYIGFNMQVVKDIVNAMGGVDYDVDIDVKMNGRTLSPGLQHLDGQQVLDYARQRKGSSDIARVDRQQRILLAIFHQMLVTKQISNVPKIFTAVEQNMATNLDFTQISALALFATGIDLTNIERHMLDGEFLNMRKTSYWGVSEAKRVRLIKDIFGITVSIDPSGDVTAIKRELEEQRKLIENELNLALTLKNNCNNVLTNYKDSLSAAEVETLKDVVKALQEAYDMEDKDELDAVNARAANLYNEIATRLNIETVSGTVPATPSPTVTADPSTVPITPTPQPQPEQSQQQPPAETTTNPTISFGNIFDN